MADPRDLIQRLADVLNDRLDYEESQYPDEGVMPLIAEARAYLATPEPAAGPTDKELSDTYWKAVQEGKDRKNVVLHDAGLRAVLARFDHQPPQPVSLSERLPGPEDCDAEGRCWIFRHEDPECKGLHSWDYGVLDTSEDWLPPVMCWIPHDALPIPRVD